MGTPIPATATIPLNPETPLEVVEELTTLETQQTSNPEPTPTEEKVFSADYVRALEEELRGTKQTVQELATVVSRQTTPTVEEPTHRLPEINDEEDRQRLFNSPRALIREELTTQLAPVLELVDMFKKDSKFKALDVKFAADARFAEIMKDQAIVDAVHQMLEVPGTPVNEQTYAASLISAVGLKAINALPNSAPTTTTPTPTRTEITPVPTNPTPPVIRPSAPPAPSNPNNPKSREPNENERRIMRENNFKTVEEYDQWMNLPSRQVVTTTLGREQK